MPIYEYRCADCGHLEEQLQKHDDPPPVCVPCDDTLPDETPYMTRQISRASFALKGGGWYADGYQKKQ